jgi:O-antigen/teichoic acid export membrane protein
MYSAGFLGLATVVSRLCNVGLLVVLARSAGQSAVGYYGIATLIASFASLTFSAGFSTYLTRGRARGEIEPDVVSAIHVGRFVALLAAAVIMTVVSGVIFHGAALYAFLGFALAAMLDQWNETAWALIRGTKRAPREALVNGLTSLLLLGICGVAFSLGRASLGFIAAACLVVAVLRSAIAVATTGVDLVQRPETVLRNVRSHLRSASPYLASDVLGLAYLRGDTLVLSLLVSVSEVGSYVAAVGMVSPLVQVAASMSLGALASVSRGGSARTISNLKVYRFFGYAGLFGSAAVMLAIFNGSRILYGGSGQTIAQLAVVLALFLPLRFLNFGLSSVLISRGHAMQRLLVVGQSIVLNIILNLCLDPSFGAAGAAWATVATELTVSLTFLFFLKDVWKSFQIWANIAVVGCVAAFLGVANVLHLPSQAAATIGGLFFAIIAISWTRGPTVDIQRPGTGSSSTILEKES